MRGLRRKLRRLQGPRPDGQADKLGDDRVRQTISSRGICGLPGSTGFVGVLMIGESFAINNGLPLSASDAVFLRYAVSHRSPVLVGT